MPIDSDMGQTADFTPVQRNRSGSRGLQIRCPHCSNPVEMLVDTPFEEISCGSCGSAFSLIDRTEQTREATSLKRLGRFELVSRLGVGGFGSVWKARDSELDRVVAIKIPRKGQLDAAEIEQFFREARAAAQLRHRNIVPVYEVGRHEDTIFIVSELVRGVDFGDWLTAKSMGPREAIELCQQVALALHHAHQHGVIHRDLKPSNIMIDDEGQPNLMDFGLAKRDVAEITMTIDGQVLGTPAYMSPEQAGGRSHWTDCRTDIYSLGVIMFRLLTGELPFRGGAQMQIHQRLTEDAPDVRSFNRHIPKDLSTICQKCLERDPNRRYSSAQLLADELNRFLQGMPILARPLSRPARLVRWAKRKPALASLAALVVVLAVGGPVTAVVIESQRRRLTELVDEKDNLIKQSVNDRQRLVASVEDLGQKVAVWEGRSKPWELWPPKPRVGPRQTLLAGLSERHYEAVARTLDQGKLSPDAAICGHLALAMLADETKRAADAKLHWAAASDLLRSGIESRPDEANRRLALADCERQLARLSAPDKSRALRRLRSASALLEIPSVSQNDFPVKTATIELAMDAAILEGFENAKQSLATAAKLHEELLASPSNRDPVQLYRKVCWLTERSPLLSGAATLFIGGRQEARSATSGQ